MARFSKSSIHPDLIAHEGEVNGRWVVEVRFSDDELIGHDAGTLVCEPSDADDSLTFTAKNGKRYSDVPDGCQWTARV